MAEDRPAGELMIDSLVLSGLTNDELQAVKHYIEATSNVNEEGDWLQITHDGKTELVRFTRASEVRLRYDNFEPFYTGQPLVDNGTVVIKSYGSPAKKRR